MRTVLDTEVLSMRTTKSLEFGKQETVIKNKYVSLLFSSGTTELNVFCGSSNLIELEILFEAWNFHTVADLVTKGVFTHVKRKCNVAWDWILCLGDIVLSTKPLLWGQD